MDTTCAYMITALYKQFFAFSTEEVQKLGLNYGQLPFVLYVGKYPSCSPKQLKEALKYDWGHTQRSITRLVDEGFLNKTRRTDDARTYALTLTEKGQQAFDVSHQFFAMWDASRMDVLSAEEQASMRAMLKKLLSAYKPDEE